MIPPGNRLTFNRTGGEMQGDAATVTVLDLVAACSCAAVRCGSSARTRSKLRHCPATCIDRAICENQVPRLHAAKLWTIALSGLKTCNITLLFNCVNHLRNPGNPRESRPMARWRPRLQAVAASSMAANTASLLL